MNKSATIQPAPAAPLESQTALAHWRGAMTGAGGALVVGAAAASICDTVFGPTFRDFVTSYYFRGHDLFWSLAVAVSLFLFAIAQRRWTLSSLRGGMLEKMLRWAPAAFALFVFLVGALGAHFIFHDFHLSRDEVLADFDSVTLRAGRAMAPVAAEWRPFAGALAPRFMLPVPNHVGFMSAYLPVNAALRALVGLFVDPNLTSPLLAALAVVAVWSVARRLWPERRDAAFLAALLVATSSQMLVAAMTSYAMTAHLALNMVWLWLFVRDDRIGHVGAVVVGALACGLHQLAFHPLFVAPFIFQLWRSRRFRLASFYVIAYGAICLFWMNYGKIVMAFYGVTDEGPIGAGGTYFLFRIYELMTAYDRRGAIDMLLNAVRFAAWQNPILLPLLYLAWRPVREGAGYARSLAWGVALTLALTIAVIPYQGHGWGYRYIHGLIGSLALLAAYGWIALSDRLKEGDLAVARAAVAGATLFAVAILLPAHALSARRFVEPYAQASNAIRHAATDVVVVDKGNLCYAEDLVRNDPFLRNRPIVLDMMYLRQKDIDELCRRFSVSVFDSRSAPMSAPLRCAPAVAFPPRETPRVSCAVAFRTKEP